MTAVALGMPRVRVARATVLAAVVVVAASLVAWWASVPYVVGVWHDDGVYALLGRAIASGQGFHYVQLPGAPAATHYPPLYPLLLAGVWRLAPSFPDNVSAFLALNALLVGVASLGAFRFATSTLGWRDDAAAAFALASAMATPVLALAGAVLSEPLFLAALWPALAAADRAARGPARRDAMAAGVAIGALMLVRTHAVALLGALALALLARRRWRDAGVATAAAVAVLLPWQLWTMLATPRVPAPLAGSYGSYLGWFAEGLREGGLPFVAATARVNLRELWLLAVDRVVPGDVALLRASAAALLLALMAAGAWRLLRRSATTVGFVALYLAIVVVWPYAPWRFVWAIWPVLMLLVAYGAWALWSLAPGRAARVVLTLALALPAFGMLRTEAAAYASRSWSAPALGAGAQIAPLVTWVGRHVPPADVVLVEGEQVISLFTGRRAAPTAPFTALEYVRPRSVARSAADLRAMLAAVPARFVLPLAPSQVAAARALVGARPGLREVATLPSGPVFEVVR